MTLLIIRGCIDDRSTVCSIKKSETTYCTLSATDHRHQLSTGYQPNIADSQRTMLAEDRKDDHNMRSHAAMSSPLTPDFESRNAAPHASYAKHRRCTSVPVLGSNGVQHVIRKFEKSGNWKVSPYTPRGNVMTAHAVPGPYAKSPSTPSTTFGKPS